MIKDMQIGRHVETMLVLTKAIRCYTKKSPPRPYAALTFSDGQYDISGNVWNYTEDRLPEVNKVYRVVADVGEYNGTKQLNNIQLRLSTDQDMSKFSKQFSKHESVNAAWDGINGYVNGLQSSALQDFIDELVISKEKEWYAATSAISMHHAGMGGNIVHTYEVMVLADAMAHMTNELGYPVAQDLVIAGAILHDVGKLETYRVNGAACEMTMDGIMAEHITTGVRMLWATNAAKQHPSVAKLLEHIILSHHGKLEFGCPVVPKFIEAEIVSRADGLSAMLAIYKEAEDKATAEQSTSSMTDRIYAVGNSQLPRRRYIDGIILAAEARTLPF